MRKNLMRRALAIGVAACFALIGAMSMAEAGRGGGAHFSGGGGRGGAVHIGGGNLGKFHSNPGGKYVGGGVGKFHTNPGGKYVYRGSGSKFHTNPGGKYAYRGWSGKYDKHHHYGHTADTAITPGTASRSIPMAAIAPISTGAPW